MKKVAIIFPDPHLAYSPTVLNLHEALSRKFEVQIIAFRNRQFPAVEKPNVRYLPIPFIQAKIYGLINRFSSTRGRSVQCLLMKMAVGKYLRSEKFTDIICVDPVSVWMAGNRSGALLHLLSLELTNNTTAYLPRINLSNIKSVIIQSSERLQALAPGFKGKVFFLQNAPSFDESVVSKPLPPKNELLFAGTGTAKFGLFQVLDFLRHFTDYRLTLQGKVLADEMEKINVAYNDLLASGRLHIHADYLSNEELLKKAATYRIGFCFYDFSFPEIDNINYRTAPSGKMFLYFAAGVPVVGVDIEGLNPVRQFNAGELIDGMSPEAINAAIEKIEAAYQQKVDGCFAAARYFSFDKAAADIVCFLEKE